MTGSLWHPEAVLPETRAVLERIATTVPLSGAYLAGGTGLALQLGHRRSDDLDWFYPERFDEERLLSSLKSQGDVSVTSRSPGTLHVVLAGVKVSFLEYGYPMLAPLRRFGPAHVADERDIACMKVSAVAARGTRRDFVDLYEISRRHGLPNVLAWFEQKYAGIHYSKVHLKKALLWFEDAEKDPMPHMLQPLDWGDVKRFFLGAVPRL